MSARKIASPVVNPETEEFWKAANEGKLLVRHCAACDEAHHYPRTICPFCGSDDTHWRQASGEAEIYTFSIIRQAGYTLGYVTLAEGPTILTNIITDDPDKLKIGDKLRLTFAESEGGQKIPVFAPRG
jgi:hypothetical protein